jgi:hypothetical protein
VTFPNGGTVGVDDGPEVTVSLPGTPPLDLSGDLDSGLVVGFPSSGGPSVVVDPAPRNEIVVSIPGDSSGSLSTVEGTVGLPADASIVVSIPTDQPFGVCPQGNGQTTVTLPAGLWVQVPVNGGYVWRHTSGALTLRRNLYTRVRY